MRNIAPKLFTSLAIIIFIFAIVIMISGTYAIRRNEPVYIFGYALAVVPTESMVGEHEDSLDMNDLVIIRKIDISDIHVEEHPVIVYQGTGNNNADILIIHRVIGESNEGLITKGDNEDTNDVADQLLVNGAQAYITDDNIQGIYVAKITFLKPIANIMTNSRSMIFAIIAVILSVILISELIHFVKTLEDKKKEDMAKQHASYLAIMNDVTRKSIKEEIKKEYLANLEQSRDAKL